MAHEQAEENEFAALRCIKLRCRQARIDAEAGQLCAPFSLCCGEIGLVSLTGGFQGFAHAPLVRHHRGLIGAAKAEAGAFIQAELGYVPAPENHVAGFWKKTAAQDFKQ